MTTSWASLRNDRGIALPTAMIALALLTTLVIAFAVLSKSEPNIAANQARAAQSRALAESGVERAAWALNAGIILDPVGGILPTVPTPYTGATAVSVGTIGTYKVAVTFPAGTPLNERMIETDGAAPSSAIAGSQPGLRHIRVTLNKLSFVNPVIPGALSARGNLQIQGSALITSAADGDNTDCGGGPRPGTVTTGTTSPTGGTVTGSPTWSGSPREEGVPTDTFERYLLQDGDLDALRNLAKCCGVYLKGDQSWSAGNKIGTDASHPNGSNGLIFVDTTEGVNITCTGEGVSQTCTPSTFPTVTITGNAAPTGYAEFSGWLIVNGSINWTGNTRARGFIYAVNDISYAGTETIYGAVISRNIRDVSSTNIDSDVVGNSTVQFDCNAAKTGNGTLTTLLDSLPHGWFPKAGTYRETAY